MSASGWSMASFRRREMEEAQKSCFNCTNISIIIALLIAGGAVGLFAYFLQLTWQLRGFLPGTNSPYVGVWWALFLAVWALIFFAEVVSRKCGGICESRSGPRWSLGFLSTLGLGVHMMAAGCMIFSRYGYDIWGGALSTGTVIVSAGVLFSVIYRVRTVEIPAVAIVLEEDDVEGDADGTDDIDAQEVSNIVAAAMPDEEVERALLIAPSPRASFGNIGQAANGLFGSANSQGTAGAVLLMSQRALRRQSRQSFFKRTFAGARFCRFSLICLNVFITLLLIVEAFAAYQAVATTVDTMLAPPPGELYPVANGAYKLHLYCIYRQPDTPSSNTTVNGTATTMPQGGNITVILESGLAAVSNFWTFVQPQLVNRSALSVDRVCSYDRAGYGWSQRGRMPRTSRQIVSELYDLLVAANITDQLVLVGHSFGGMNARLFAAQYPANVSGLVLIDPMHEYQNNIYDVVLNKTAPSDPTKRPEARGANQARLWAPVGVWRIITRADPLIIWKQLPAQDQSTQIAWSSVNGFPDAIWSEGIFVNTASSNEVNRTRYEMPGGSFGDLPLTVLTAGQTINGTCQSMGYDPQSKDCHEFLKLQPVQYDLQKDIAGLSQNSTWQIVWESGHNIPLEQPDVVIDAILETAQRARKYRPSVAAA